MMCDCNENIVSVRDRILEFSSFMIFARLFISLLWYTKAQHEQKY